MLGQLDCTAAYAIPETGFVNETCDAVFSSNPTWLLLRPEDVELVVEPGAV